MKPSWKMSEVSTCVVEAMIRGYHEYKSIWEAEMGEILACIREPSNVHDPYAVAVVKSSIIVGHVPRKFSSICSIFIRKGGTISCQVSGGRRYSADLPQGGLEIPCVLKFQGKVEDVNKVKKLAALILTPNPTLEPPAKKKRVDQCGEDKQTSFPPRNKVPNPLPSKQVKGKIGLNPALKEEECKRISSGEMLSDISMHWAQYLLKTQFPTLNGFQSTLLQQRKIIGDPAKNSVQIIHRQKNHWIVASTVGCEEVQVYDSLYELMDKPCEDIISNLFCNSKIKMMECCKQEGYVDCGIFAIANATAIAHGINPGNLKFNQLLMRKHLLDSFEQEILTPFPIY